MKKLSILCFISLILISNCINNKEFPNSKKLKIKKYLKQEWQIQKKLLFFNKKVKSGSKEIKYNKSGKKNQLLDYRNDGSLCIKKYYQYENKQCIENSTTYNPDKTIFQEKVIYKYDVNNNLIEKVRYYPIERLFQRIFYKYNDKNKLIESLIYSYEETPGKVKWKYYYKYDKNNKLIQELGLHSDNTFAYKVNYIYNKEGQLKEKIFFLNDHKNYRFKEIYKYNKDKNIKCILTYHNDFFFEILPFKKYVFNYNDNSNIIKEAVYTRTLFGLFYQLHEYSTYNYVYYNK